MSRRRTRTLAAVSAVAAAPLLLTCLPPSAASASSWASTLTTAPDLVHATSLGAAPAATPLRLTVGLAPRNVSMLRSLIRAQATPGSPSYRHFLTPAQFTSRFAATTGSAGAVRDYLTGQGMRNVSVSSNRLQVTADATVAQAQTAFHTSINRFSQFGRTILANTAPAQVPSALGGTVTGVLGLSTLGMSSGPKASAGLPKLDGFYPKEFTKVYSAGGTKAGTGQSLAVIAEGDLTQTVKDLRVAESKQKLPQVPVSLVRTGPASNDTAGTDEWNLDTQTSTGVAPSAKRLYVYVATSLTNSDLARAVNRFAADDKAQAGSASLGECDVLAFADGSAVVDDIAFAEAASQGQTFFASTGDTGSSCAVAPTNGVPGSGPTDTEYPASSPYVVGVGGTTLLASADDTYTSEVAWNGGGGGISPVESSGYWQNGVVPSATAGARGLPDVAFDADPATGGNIYVSGSPETIGGTSLASPLALGLWTRVNAAKGGKAGFASPRIYGIYAKAQTTQPLPPTTVPAAFHDVVVGTNGAYQATPGYDFTTGLGSWNVDKLVTALK